MSEPGGGSSTGTGPHAGSNEQLMHATRTRTCTPELIHSRVAALCVVRACALADYEPAQPRTARRRRQIYDKYAPLPSSISFRLDTPSHVDHLLVPNRFPDTALELCSHARLSASLYLNKLLGIQNLLSSCAQHLAHTIHAMPCPPCLLAHMPCHAMQPNSPQKNTAHRPANRLLIMITVAATICHGLDNLQRHTACPLGEITQSRQQKADLRSHSLWQTMHARFSALYCPVLACTMPVHKGYQA